MERRTLAGEARAGRRERSAHRLGQAPTDCQAQTCATEASGDRCVGLAEGLEQAAHPIGRDADAGVPNVDPNLPLRTGKRRTLGLLTGNRDDHLATVGELDGIR